MEEIGYIDWERAKAVGRGLVPPGPKLPAPEIKSLVASIKEAAGKAGEHVARVTELDAPAAADILVLDRARWIEACAASAGVVLANLGATDQPKGRIDKIAGTTRGVQVGVAFAAVATRVLGQFDPFSPASRLLLVAPNVAEVESELKVDPEDFRLWVCLHEETHRFQFGHAPWLTGHILNSIKQLLDAEGEVSWPKKSDRSSLLDMVMSPEQKAQFDQVSAVMTLMEGHADVMMDRVGVQVLPTLPIIRRAFEARRDRRGWTALLGKFIGADLKLAQYRDGAQFCRAVIDAVGVPGLNKAFSAAEFLPSWAEIHDPAAWVSRVHP
ncbi:MAG: zinc-dependent metalloprotease [Propionibacteriaceae bacterium]|nr:zinc-dependent metalloprotease [Propionibacteriaceae bacterium]